MKKEQKKSNEYIAFEGEKFLIEWYFDSKGHSIALDYFESLNEDEQILDFSHFPEPFALRSVRSTRLEGLPNKK